MPRPGAGSRGRGRSGDRRRVPVGHVAGVEVVSVPEGEVVLAVGAGTYDFAVAAG